MKHCYSYLLMYLLILIISPLYAQSGTAPDITPSTDQVVQAGTEPTLPFTATLAGIYDCPKPSVQGACLPWKKAAAPTWQWHITSGLTSDNGTTNQTLLVDLSSPASGTVSVLQVQTWMDSSPTSPMMATTMSPGTPPINVDIVQLQFAFDGSTKPKDQLVRGPSKYPPAKFTTSCTVQNLSKSQTKPLQITLSSLNGNLGLSTTSLELPVPPAPVPFQITGNTNSISLNDSSILVNGPTGVQIGETTATVFWFDKSTIDIQTLHPYSQRTAILTRIPELPQPYNIYAPAMHTACVKMVSETILQPVGVALDTSPQYDALALGVSQVYLANSGNNARYEFDHVTWEQRADTSGKFKNKRVKVPEEIFEGFTTPTNKNDTSPDSNPVYWIHRLVEPISTKKVSSDNRDAPNDVRPVQEILPIHIKDDFVGVAYYKLHYVSINQKFNDWAVIYDPTATPQVEALQQSSWNVKINTDGANQYANPSTGDFPPTSLPLAGTPYANGTDVNLPETTSKKFKIVIHP